MWNTNVQKFLIFGQYCCICDFLTCGNSTTCTTHWINIVFIIHAHFGGYWFDFWTMLSMAKYTKEEQNGQVHAQCIINWPEVNLSLALSITLALEIYIYILTIKKRTNDKKLLSWYWQMIIIHTVKLSTSMYPPSDNMIKEKRCILYSYISRGIVGSKL